MLTNEKIKQFASQTLEDAKNRHRVGLMSSVTLVHTYFEVMLDYGWRRKFDQKEVCEELGVSKSTFYRTLSLCKLEGYLDFEAVGGVSVKNVNPYHRKACVKSETEVSRNSDLGEEEEPETEMAGTVVSNLKPVGSNLKPVGQISDSSFKSETATPSKPLPEAEHSTPSYSSQINNQINSYSLHKEDGERDFFLEDQKTQTIEVIAKEVKDKEEPTKPTNKPKKRNRTKELTGELITKEDKKGSEACTNEAVFEPSREAVQNQTFNWLPDGPWNIDGKLDPNFRDWLAGKWVKEYGKDIHTQRANVLSHFKKDPANLPIRWEQYQGEYLDRFTNTQILLNNGIEIKPEYQKTLIANQRALTALPEEVNPIYQPSMAGTFDKLRAGTQEALSATPQVASPTPALIPNKEQGREVVSEPSREVVSEQGREVVSEPSREDEYITLEDGMKLKVFNAVRPNKSGATLRQCSGATTQTPEPFGVAQEPEVTPEEARRNRETVNNMLKGWFGGVSFPSNQKAPPAPPSEFYSLNEMLHQPALREEAIATARRSEKFEYRSDLDEIIYRDQDYQDF